jgi:hypothetical protein
MMTLEQALAGINVPNDICASLALVHVRHVGFDGAEHDGQLVVHGELADEVRAVFTELLARRFPIEKIVPVVAYGWDDDASMADNNSSGFNYRVIAGTDRLSNHAFGRAIDINPVQNPYVRIDGLVMPTGATYDTSVPGTVTEDIAGLFTKLGWKWGGHWTDRKDWQHFDKNER